MKKKKLLCTVTS